MEIGDWSADSGRVYFIAEAGVNHNGDLETAKQLVDVAVESGADAVKFQTFTVDSLVSDAAETAPYQRREVGIASQRDLLSSLELGRDEHELLQTYCRDSGIEFLSTPFDFESAAYLDSLDVSAFKIGSGDLTNHPLLGHVAEFGRPMVVSTGMSTLDEVRDAYRAIKDSNPDVPLSILHCVSAYPTPMDEANLEAIRTLEETFQVPVGFSDHTTAPETPALAVATGSHIIEKHLTLDRQMEGPDHAASLEPDELFRAVSLVRDAEQARGDGIKRPMPSERDTIEAARKGLYAARDITAGERIGEDDVLIQRPPKGLEPSSYYAVIGQTALRNLSAGEPLTGADIA